VNIDGMPRWPRWTVRFGVGSALLLLAPPIVYLIENVLHPIELAPGSEAGQLEIIGADPARWQGAHMIGFLALLLSLPLTIALSMMVARLRPRLALAGMLMALTGLVAIVFIVALHGFAWGALGAVSVQPGVDQATVAASLHEIQQSGWLTPYLLLIGFWPAGLFLLLFTGARAGLFPARPVGVMAFGIAAVGLQGTVIHSKDYYVASSSVLVAATIVFVVWLWRTMRPDDADEEIAPPRSDDDAPLPRAPVSVAAGG
jgi:hypothetical protein